MGKLKQGRGGGGWRGAFSHVAPSFPPQIKLIFSSSGVERAQNTAHLVWAPHGAHRGSRHFI